MNDLYTFFGLHDQPFGASADPRYLYMSHTHQSAWTALVQAIEWNLGMSVVAGDPGMGKTLLLFRLIERFRATATVALIFETQCDSAGLLRHLAREFGFPTTPANVADAGVLYDYVLDCIMSTAHAGRRVVLLIDEAQNLEAPALETIRLLSNIETSKGKLLHIVLTGQLSLLRRLSSEDARQLQQRIWTNCMLTPLSIGETAEYVNHRLAVAGYEGDGLFDEEALALVACESRGIPRLINRICFHALVEGMEQNRRTIDRTVLEDSLYAFGSSAPVEKTKPVAVSRH